jgi:hypothetical protein
VNVLNISSGQDTGGQQLRTARAFRKHAPDWTYTTVTKRSTFYPIENPWSGGRIRREWWPAADVIHAHNNLLGIDRFERKLGRKPTVLHMHGTIYRSNPDLSQTRDALVIVSTMDLWALHPDKTEWLPAPYDIDWLASLRPTEWVEHRNGPLRIAHAPTNETVKSTEALRAAVDRLKREGHNVELDVIRNQQWHECLRRKAQADIYFDQVLLGYGCNAVEAWGMGIPVIAGVDPERLLTIKAMQPQSLNPATLSIMRQAWGELPFYEATEDTIYDALLELMDPEARALYAERGMAHVRKYHDERKVVEQLQELYYRAALRDMAA